MSASTAKPVSDVREDVVLYVILGSHACRAASLMLEHKQIAYRRVLLPTGAHPMLVRALGFPGHRKPIRSVDGATPGGLRLLDRLGTVPALRFGSERVQTNRAIASFLDRVRPQPPLFPDEPARRNAVEEARELLAGLPAQLDRIDAWIADGVLDGPRLNAADFIIAPSLALIAYRLDRREQIDARPAGALLDRVLSEPALSGA